MLSRKDLPNNLGDDEREEIIFQLEDIGYDLQDAALEGYKQALELAESEFVEDQWLEQILQHLAVLDPERYGSFSTKVLTSVLPTDNSWRVSPDSAVGWLALNFKDGGWARAQEYKGDKSWIFHRPA